MKKLMMALGILVACFTAISVPAQTGCSDNFSWMATSTVPPGDTPCTTWSQESSNSYESQQYFGSEVWSWRMLDAPITTTSYLYFGGAGQEFQLTNLSVIIIKGNWSLESNYDGFIFEVSRDGGTTWLEVIISGATLNPPYSHTMTAGPLRPSKAYSGTFNGQTLVDCREMTSGPALFRIKF